MKTKLLFLSTLLFSFSINAQIDFEAHITVDDTGGTNNPTSVYAADLDGDGDMDMLSASNADYKIAWYENTDSQGNFGPQQIIQQTNIRPSGVSAADIDSDGDMDVIATAQGKIIWFKNLNGQGSFASAEEISSDIGAYSLYVDDLDNDGDMDILVSSSSINTISWFENLNGQGSFSSQIIIPSNVEYPDDTRTSDIDGDGDMDILSGSGYTGNSVTWFKNTNGQGNFLQQQVLTTDITYMGDTITADVDGDGDLDILVASQKLEGHRIIWFENINGLGNFNNTPNIIDSENINNPDVLYATDFDNDGDIDVAVGTLKEIVWYKNNGGGNFGNKQIIDNNVEGTNSLFTTDIDADGDDDLLISARTSDRIAWHENLNGQGNFGPANELADINGANGPYHVHSVDIDNDGDKDIIAALTFDNRVVWQENLDGQGTFSELKNIGLLERTIAVYTGDMDGDGKMDVLAAGRSKVVWYKNLDGQGNFGPEQIIYLEEYAYSDTVYVADIDNDGDLDVFSFVGIKLFWQENNGTGSFGPAQTISTEIYGCDSMVTADIDNDGDKDLVASDWANGKVFWFENTDGQGSFTTFILTDSLIDPDAVDVGDFDNDGDIDIVTLDYGTDEIMWYENMDGQGNFGSAQIISNTVSGPFSLKATDIDNDGDMDVLVTSYPTASLWLFQNDGNGIFNNGQMFTSTVVTPIFVTADDFNGDGKMDVLAPSYSSDEIIWFENRGPLSIEENISNLFSIYPNPTSSFLNIKSKSTISEITVYNNLGQLLFTSEEKNKIDISTLSEGIYFVKIKDENGQTETKKVIKN